MDAHNRLFAQLTVRNQVAEDVLELVSKLRDCDDILVRENLIDDIEDALIAITAGPLCQQCGCSPIAQCEGGCVGHETGRCSLCPRAPGRVQLHVGDEVVDRLEGQLLKTTGLRVIDGGRR